MLAGKVEGLIAFFSRFYWLIVMQYRNNKTRIRTALTLLEMVIAMAIMAIIFAAILPQFRVIQNSLDSQAGAAETLQNGRVLIDHLNRNLSKAVRITAVSSSSETNGYIEFIGNDANNVRYDVNSISNYVEFGLVGSLSDLAGPVSKLQFTCYNATDLSTPITDVNAIRSVKVETTLTNPAKLDQDMTFSTQAYIRTNALPAAWGNISKLSEPWLEFDTQKGGEPALSQIDQTHYLCAYGANSEVGKATVLAVDTGTWAITKETPFEFDTQGITPALSKIDDTHYLCAYSGPFTDGWAVVLTVNTGDWIITKETPFEFDTIMGMTPALEKIDTSHYLCTYQGDGYDGWAVVLTVDTGTWQITKETPFEFDASNGDTPALSKIDDTHYLCAHTSTQSDGWATVLTIDTGTWAVTKETPFEFDTDTGLTPALVKIDGTHYLCAYTGQTDDGWATVLMVDTGTWEITKGTSFEFDGDQGIASALSRIDGTHYLCAYRGSWSDGWATVLMVDTGTWEITKGTPFEFDMENGLTHALSQIDSTHYLCAYEGVGNDSWAGVLELSEKILP